MPELPEVEILVRHLRTSLLGKIIRRVQVRRPRVLRPTTARQLSRALLGRAFTEVSRRGKYIRFTLQGHENGGTIPVLGHLGMTGRMYVIPVAATLPKHATVVLDLGEQRLVFEDTRYFGRFTLDRQALERLGPEPLGSEFTLGGFAQALKRSTQAIKVKLLDQSLVAGIGNIYASESLFEAGIGPGRQARSLNPAEAERLWTAIRSVLSRAIDAGSTVPLDFPGGSDGLFYFGGAKGASESYVERLQVYDRAGQPCVVCGTAIRRLVQAARSTFYCPVCQKKNRTPANLTRDGMGTGRFRALLGHGASCRVT